MKKEDLIKEWERRASEYLSLSEIGKAAPPQLIQLHNNAKGYRAKAEIYTRCIQELRECE